MPRNDQVTRLWYLLRNLEATHGVPLHQLADSLPKDLTRHLRTVRRDLEPLEAAGFPILTECVDGGVVWKLIEGFRRTPAPAFSPMELLAFAFSRGLLRPLRHHRIFTTDPRVPRPACIKRPGFSRLSGDIARPRW